MQGFVPERSFTKDRRDIDMRIDSVLMVCGTPDQCRRFEVPTLPAANSARNFKSKATLESWSC